MAVHKHFLMRNQPSLWDRHLTKMVKCTSVLSLRDHHLTKINTMVHLEGNHTSTRKSPQTFSRDIIMTSHIRYSPWTISDGGIRDFTSISSLRRLYLYHAYMQRVSSPRLHAEGVEYFPSCLLAEEEQKYDFSFREEFTMNQLPKLRLFLSKHITTKTSFFRN